MGRRGNGWTNRSESQKRCTPGYRGLGAVNMYAESNKTHSGGDPHPRKCMERETSIKHAPGTFRVKYMDMDMIWNQKGHQEGKAWRRGLVETKTPELPGSPVKKTSKRGDQLYQMLPLRKQGKGYKRQDLTRITKLLALPRAAMTVQLLLFVRV